MGLPSYTTDAMRANWEYPERVKIIIYWTARLKVPSRQSQLIVRPFNR